jgi:hypothetical protein
MWWRPASLPGHHNHGREIWSPAPDCRLRSIPPKTIPLNQAEQGSKDSKNEHAVSRELEACGDILPSDNCKANQSYSRASSEFLDWYLPSYSSRRNCNASVALREVIVFSGKLPTRGIDQEGVCCGLLQSRREGCRVRIRSALTRHAKSKVQL